MLAHPLTTKNKIKANEKNEYWRYAFGLVYP